MPNFDQTGPAGQGSMTGRRMGRCANKTVEPAPTDTNAADTNLDAGAAQPRGMGMAWRRGGGGGRGMGGRRGGFGMGRR